VRLPKLMSQFFLSRIVRPVVVLFGATFLTLNFFLVLPVMQSIAKPPEMDIVLTSAETAKIEAPDEPAEIEEPEPEPEPEQEPPKLADDTPPMDLSQLEVALNPGFSDSAVAGSFVMNFGDVMKKSSQETAQLFSVADLDQKPRVIYQTSANLSSAAKKRRPGKVQVIFVVDENGRVVKPTIRSSSDPIFEKAALATVKKWKFEPGKRNGKPVRFRMLVPVSFTK